MNIPLRAHELRKLRELTVEERVLLVQAAACLLCLRLLLFILPFRHVNALVRHWSKPGQAPIPGGRIAYLINAAANRIPRTTCLPRALVAQILLRRHGHHAELHIGVAKDPSGSFQAHAWVESAGRIIIGGFEVGRYSRLLSFSTESPEGPVPAGPTRSI